MREQHDDEEEILDDEAERHAKQELRRSIIQRVQACEDQLLLESVLEMIEDAESDVMEAGKDPEEVASAENEYERPGNRRLPPPIHQKYKNDPDSWLDGLHR